MKDTTSPSRTVFVIFLFFFIAALASSYYKYFHTKNYDYLVEAECDPQTATCFYRDCASDPYACPPNNFSYYKQYYVKGYNFPQCSDGTCSQECESGTLTCEPLLCDTENGDECVGPHADDFYGY